MKRGRARSSAFSFPYSSRLGLRPRAAIRKGEKRDGDEQERERERERERRGLDGKRDGVHLILPGTEID